QTFFLPPRLRVLRGFRWPRSFGRRPLATGELSARFRQAWPLRCRVFFFMGPDPCADRRSNGAWREQLLRPGGPLIKSSRGGIAGSGPRPARRPRRKGRIVLAFCLILPDEGR